MSDTVKLIIEIPKSALELLNTTGVDWLDAEHILSAVAKGTLLDDVKAEIDEQYDRVHPYNIYVAQGLEMALDILDNIGKESEG